MNINVKSIFSVVLMMTIIFYSFAPAYAETTPEGEIPIQPGNVVKVISYNIWTQMNPGTINALELRGERLKQVISQYAPDSMGFQEARYEWMVWLKNNMTDYDYVGVGRENGVIDPNSGEASPIFYLKSKFNVVDSGTFWLSPTPDVPSIGWDAAYKRVCTWVILENKTTKERYAHLNTHLDHMGSQARAEGVELIKNKINELGATYPIVCTGDFNASMYSEPYRIMTDRTDVTSSVYMADTLFCAEQVVNMGGTMPDLSVPPSVSELQVDGGLAIDHCFISPGKFDAKYYKVMRDTVGDNYISDHYGLYVELMYGKETQERPMPENPYVEKTYQAPYGTATIDGIMDASYSNANVMDVNKRSSGNSTTVVANAKVRTIYDNNYLYYFAEVTDTTPNINTTTSKQDGHGIDGFQMYFDFVNNDPADATSSNYNYEINNGVANHESGFFTCYPKGVTLPFAEFGAAAYSGDETKLQYRTTKTPTGYNIEAKVALSNSLKQRLANDEQNIAVGVGYQVNDDLNDDGYRNCDIYSNPRLISAWMSPLYLDKLILVSDTPIDQPIIATKGTPNMDGMMDDVYKNAQAIRVNHDGLDRTVTNQAYATARTIYDDNYLYCFATVTDATYNTTNTRPIKNYGIDGVQFFVDFIGNNTFTANESGYIITDLVATDDKLVNGGKIGRAGQGFSTFTKGNQYDYRAVPTYTGNIQTGYNVEFKIALSNSLKEKMKTQKNLGIRIGFQVNDDKNNDGTREALCYSKGAIENAWKPEGPTMLNTIILSSEDNSTYGITFDSGITGGVITADKTTAKVGELVTLTVTPNEGKRLKRNTLSYNDIALIKYSFIMPGKDVIIKAEFEDVPVIPIDYSAYMAAKGTPTIDGIMDDTYKGTQPILVNKDDKNRIVTDRATAQIRTIYDDQYIYCFAKVTDATPNTENTRPKSTNYGVDGVQFFFDFYKNSEVYMRSESGYIITDLVATDDKLANGNTIGRLQQGLAGYTKDQYEYKAVKTDTGYYIELKLALSNSLKDKLSLNEDGIKVGIGFQVNDDTNNDGIREKLCCSDKAIYNAWEPKGPTMMANMYLTKQSEVSYYIGATQTSGGNISTDKKTSKAGEIVNVIITPDEGYQLKKQTLMINGIVIEGTSFTMPDSNVMITAEFEAVPKLYSVTYDGNANTEGSVPVDEKLYNTEDTVTVIGNTGNLVKTGYTFADWNTAANGSGTSYNGENTFAMGSCNVTLYAQWTLDSSDKLALSEAIKRAEQNKEIDYTVESWLGFKAALDYANSVFVNEDATTSDINKAIIDLTVAQQALQYTIKEIKDVNVSCYVGQAPILPTVVTAVYADNSMSGVGVIWDSISSDKYQKVGAFTVSGAVYGSNVKAIANIKIMDLPVPTPDPDPIPPVVDRVVVNQDETVEIKPDVKVDINKRIATNEVSTEDIKKAFEKAKEDIDKGRIISIDIPETKGINQYIQRIPVEIISSISNKNKIEVSTPFAKVIIQENMLNGIDANKNTFAEIVIKAVDRASLPPQIIDIIGNKPIIDLSVKVDNQAIEWKNYKAPVIVSIAYNPSAEELVNPEHILALYIDVKGNVQPIPNAKFDSITRTINFTTTHFSKFSVAFVNKSFNDISDVSWAKKQIEVLASKGVIKGTSEISFSPNENATRADFITLLIRALELKSEYEANFEDVNKDSYYSESIGIAKALGIVKGTGNNKFNPNETISRQDMMTMVGNALKAYNKKLDTASNNDLSSFKDVSYISEYALENIALMVKNGLVFGNENLINPNGKATRAEIAVILYRIINK